MIRWLRELWLRTLREDFVNGVLSDWPEASYDISETPDRDTVTEVRVSRGPPTREELIRASEVITSYSDYSRARRFVAERISSTSEEHSSERKQGGNWDTGYYTVETTTTSYHTQEALKLVRAPDELRRMLESPH